MASLLRLVKHNFDFLSIHLRVVHAFNGSLCFFAFGELNVAETSAGAIGEALEFAGGDLAEFLKHIENFFLLDFLGQVAHEDISFGVELEVVFHDVQENSSALDHGVVHFPLAAVSLFLGVEIKVSIALLAAFVLVLVGLSALDFVSGASEMLEQI